MSEDRIRALEERVSKLEKDSFRALYSDMEKNGLKFVVDAPTKWKFWMKNNKK